MGPVLVLRGGLLYAKNGWSHYVFLHVIKVIVVVISCMSTGRMIELLYVAYEFIIGVGGWFCVSSVTPPLFFNQLHVHMLTLRMMRSKLYWKMFVHGRVLGHCINYFISID